MHHLLGICHDGIDERRELAVFEVQDSISHIQDAIVAHDQQEASSAGTEKYCWIAATRLCLAEEFISRLASWSSGE